MTGHVERTPSQHGRAGAKWLTDLRWPALAVIVSAALLGVSTLLDAGSETQRDLALMLGTVTLYGLAPLSLLWLIVASWMTMAKRSKNRSD